MKSRIILQGEEDSRLTTIVIDEMATRISQYFAGLLDNADTGIEVIAEWLEAANDFRIFPGFLVNGANMCRCKND